MRVLFAILTLIPTLAFAVPPCPGATIASFVADTSDRTEPIGSSTSNVNIVSRTFTGDTRAIMPFGTFALPTGAAICKALLTVMNTATAGGQPIIAGQVSGGNYVVGPFSPTALVLAPTTMPHVFDVTPIVNGWPGTMLHLEGIGLREQMLIGLFQDEVASADHGTAAYHPLLEVWYY